MYVLKISRKELVVTPLRRCRWDHDSTDNAAEMMPPPLIMLPPAALTMMIPSLIMLPLMMLSIAANDGTTRR